MEELFILTLILALIAIVVIILGMTGQIRLPRLISRSEIQDSVSRAKSPASSEAASNQITETSALPDPRELNCRIQLTKQQEGEGVFDAFTVQIGGTIHAPEDMHHTTLQILITDVTDEVHDAKPIHSRLKQWQLQDSPTFCYNADLGRLPQQTTILSDWTDVAQLHLDWLMFPHKGQRNLQYTTSILSRRNGQEIASATCNFTYDNPEPGYTELQENVQRTKILAVSLAFAVSAADRKLYNCEVELIKNWARSNLDFSQASDKTRRELEKALNRTVAFFSNGNKLDVYKTCKEIVEIVPLAERYDILDLCLHVAQANGVASAEEMALLKNLADWLEVDTNRFRDMVEKILPVGMHEASDQEVILGVSADMSKEKTRQQLNKEYNKWNSRVTNPDPEIQHQADQMLKLIAEARVRSECIS
ncbi:MAG: tellurite resistance TerB family protein [Planctomycetota bacterium]|jgi:tellurite resistance protein